MLGCVSTWCSYCKLQPQWEGEGPDSRCGAVEVHQPGVRYSGCTVPTAPFPAPGAGGPALGRCSETGNLEKCGREGCGEKPGNDS